MYFNLLAIFFVSLNDFYILFKNKLMRSIIAISFTFIKCQGSSAG